MRKQLAAALSLFVLGVFGYSSVAVYDWYFGVPEGLTGGRTKAALPGNGSIRVRGGFVQGVNEYKLDLRATAPNLEIGFENNGGGSSTYSVNLMNVNPRRIAIGEVPESSSGNAESFEFEEAGPSRIHFEVTLAPGDRRTFHLGLEPENPEEVRFFVFGHVRNGELFFSQLQRIAELETPDFMFCLGDSYYRAFPDKILELERTLGELSVPVYVIRGEIEYRDQDEPSPADTHPVAQFYRLDRHPAIFGPNCHDFAYQDWRFIFFENGRDRNILAFDWLEDLPADEPGLEGTVFLSHIPPYDPRTVITKDVTTGNPDEQETMVQQMKRLDTTAAFFSHYRWFEEREVEGIPTYTTSVSVPKQSGRQTPHFLDVTLREGRVQVHWRTLVPSEVAAELRKAQADAESAIDGEQDEF